MSDVIRPVRTATNMGAKDAQDMRQSGSGTSWSINLPVYRGSVAVPSGHTTNYLRLTDFDFSSVKDNAVIDGVLFTISRSGLNDLYDSSVRIMISGNIGGTDKSNVETWATPSGAIYGSSVSKWGETLTPRVIKEHNFGVAIAATNNNASGNIAYVHDCTAIVYYSFPTIREGSSTVYVNKFGNTQAVRPTRSISNNWVSHSGKLTSRLDDYTY